MSIPSIGQIVHYTLNEADAETINKRRADFEAFDREHRTQIQPGEPGATGHQAHVGNYAAAGDVYPAMIVRLFDPNVTTSNLQVFLDGNDTYWATSRMQGDGPGSWAWPLRH